MSDDTGEDIYFALPGSAIKGIPIIHGGEKLSIGLVEVGCNPGRKRPQLRHKRDFVTNFWNREYRGPHGLDWTPVITRTLAHYAPGEEPESVHRNCEPDTYITYSTITPDMFAQLSEEERDLLRREVKDCGQQKAIKRLDAILKSGNAADLQKLIMQQRDVPEFSGLRGILAEVFVHNDMESAMPPGMSLYKNSDIAYFSSKFSNGTEVDGILTSWGESSYEKLIAALQEKDHLQIKTNTNGVANG